MITLSLIFYSGMLSFTIMGLATPPNEPKIAMSLFFVATVFAVIGGVLLAEGLPT